MTRRSRPTFAFALIASFVVASSLMPAHAQAPRIAPSAQLDPPEVVQAMLAALKKGTDEGIAELYEFSSPGNRASTGPYARFQEMIRLSFPDMLGHRAAKLAPALIDGDRAMLPVEILGSDNEIHPYVFLLSRQTIPECDGCWMADAVVSPDALNQPAPDYPT